MRLETAENRLLDAAEEYFAALTIPEQCKALPKLLKALGSWCVVMNSGTARVFMAVHFPDKPAQKTLDRER